jgi:glycosyltransferase involved in cell wall biosynthesis
MEKVSIIIPARSEPFLQKTIDEVSKNATGEIEIIVMLDAYWPDPPLIANDRLTIVHNGGVRGMRGSINAAAKIATGKYLMKLDGHCMVGRGFDDILVSNCKKNWIAVPSRYSLNADKWERFRGPVDYLYLTFPYNIDDLYGFGFHGRKWKGEHGLTGSYWYMEQKKKDIKIDDIISFQGSCWFMHKQHFFDIDCMDEKNYNFHQEATELSFKTWLSGGRVVRNKNTWYAHLHKGTKHGRGFRLSKRQMIESEIFSADFWMNDRWHKQTRQLSWLIDKFGPLEGWPEDWQNPKYQKKYTHPGLKKYPQLAEQIKTGK